MTLTTTQKVVLALTILAVCLLVEEAWRRAFAENDPTYMERAEVTASEHGAFTARRIRCKGSICDAWVYTPSGRWMWKDTYDCSTPTSDAACRHLDRAP